jgi:PIN domain nuclease of toxin-antitoxin system
VEALSYLDTHVVAWLYAGEVQRFPAPARHHLERSELRISPAVCLELQYLYEIRRVQGPALEVVSHLTQALGLKVCDLPFSRVASAALEQSWTRDPFDRLITAQAACQQAWLLTKDETIAAHYPRALWAQALPGGSR